MKKKHTYNWLICLGLFMPKPELSQGLGSYRLLRS